MKIGYLVYIGVSLSIGTYEIGVHIADVSHFIPEHSPLDKVAACRATSVYLVQKVGAHLYLFPAVDQCTSVLINYTITKPDMPTVIVLNIE